MHCVYTPAWLSCAWSCTRQDTVWIRTFIPIKAILWRLNLRFWKRDPFVFQSFFLNSTICGPTVQVNGHVILSLPRLHLWGSLILSTNEQRKYLVGFTLVVQVTKFWINFMSQRNYIINLHLKEKWIEFWGNLAETLPAFNSSSWGFFLDIISILVV